MRLWRCTSQTRRSFRSRAEVVQGQDAIRQALRQFLALKGTIQVNHIFTVHGPANSLGARTVEAHRDRT